MSTLLRTLAHAILIIAASNLVGLAPTNAGLHAILGALLTGHAIPFGITFACILNNQRWLLTSTLALLLLAAWPLRTEQLVTLTISVAGGLALGTLARRIHHDAQPAQPPSVLPRPLGVNPYDRQPEHRDAEPNRQRRPRSGADTTTDGIGNLGAPHHAPHPA
ncbi:MAG: hypothetical protein M3167_00390 [Acidobacteriota bacterium]|nr:hypothetical protein [Acidobacteriota bacterium]